MYVLYEPTRCSHRCENTGEKPASKSEKLVIRMLILSNDRQMPLQLIIQLARLCIKHCIIPATIDDYHYQFNTIWTVFVFLDEFLPVKLYGPKHRLTYLLFDESTCSLVQTHTTSNKHTPSACQRLVNVILEPKSYVEVKFYVRNQQIMCRNN